jgi:hypothetical protein
MFTTDAPGRPAAELTDLDALREAAGAGKPLNAAPWWRRQVIGLDDEDMAGGWVSVL